MNNFDYSGILTQNICKSSYFPSIKTDTTCRKVLKDTNKCSLLIKSEWELLAYRSHNQQIFQITYSCLLYFHYNFRTHISN